MGRALTLIILAAAATAWSLGALAADWQPVPGNLLTDWSAKVDLEEGLLRTIYWYRQKLGL